MKTLHKIIFKNSTDMSYIDSETVDLVITSPPYPMIEMWDSLFSTFNEEIKQSLEDEDGKRAFSLMHVELDKIWKESSRVLKVGGMACINIGDATRKINKNFQLFPNHVKITNFFQEEGFISLPCILWRKPTNSPTKFLGSGMLPPNAYITLEHEYILLFRKGNKKREIAPKSESRYESAYFWEERNNWFSDMWTDIKGTSQIINKNNKENNDDLRERSAAFPLELPYRLLNMFSIYNDTILDPFWGTGTSSLAAIISGRNSIGYELNSHFKDIFQQNLRNIGEISDTINNRRIQDHIEFTKEYKRRGKEFKYKSINYNFPVMTKQEENIQFYSINNEIINDDEFTIEYEKFIFESNKKLVQSRLIP